MPSAVHSDKYTPPEHFRLGSVIELADGRLKRVEDLRTEDFEVSARQSSELRLDRSVVTRITERPPAATAHIVFAVGTQRMEVAVEAQLEHPFFVFQRGWSSCAPARSLQLYGLRCRQLAVGDACVSLAPRTAAERPAHPQHGSQAAAAGHPAHPQHGGQAAAAGQAGYHHGRGPAGPPAQPANNSNSNHSHGNPAANNHSHGHSNNHSRSSS